MAEEGLLLWGQEIIAPGYGRAERLLPLGEIVCLPAQHRETLPQTLQDHVGRKECRASGRQLDGERQAVEMHDQLGHRLRIFLREHKGWVDRPRPVQKQCNRRYPGEILKRADIVRIRKSERRHVKNLLGPQVERFPTRGQQGQLRGSK